MTSVGIATAAAGIIVGTVSLTGIGLVMTEIVETASGGNLMAMLVLTALICLILGIGMPTTANYVVVATLMAPVLVEVAAAERSRGAAGRGASVRVLFRLDGGRASAGGSGRLCRRGDLRRRSDQDRPAGILVRNPHRAAALHLHLQHRTAADRRRRRRPFPAGGRLLDHRHGLFRRGDAELAADAQPLVRNHRAAADLLHAVPAGLLARPAAGAVRCAAGLRRHAASSIRSRGARPCASGS